MAVTTDTARRRKPARSTARRMINDFIPPEAVPLHFEVGTLGARFAAQVIDILITVFTVGALLLFLRLTEIVPSSAMVLLGSLLFFAMRVPYYIASELMWNGQTLGKRVCRLRVISSDGGGLTAHSVVVRNLMKEVEVFAPGIYLLVGKYMDIWTNLTTLAWIAVLIAVPLFNRRRQRLGDMIAGTYVIHQPEAILVPDLAAASRPAAANEKFVFLPHQLDHYGRYELQTLERVLHLDRPGMTLDERDRHQQNLMAIARNIRRKIQYEEPVADHDTKAFLDAFYVAQRRYLEQRKLFGDAREDKFHRDGGVPEDAGK